MSERIEKAPICATCNDTHQMLMLDAPPRLVMCTRCPTPCQLCRQGGNGPYCERTPCSCSCHRKADAPASGVDRVEKARAQVAVAPVALRDYEVRRARDHVLELVDFAFASTDEDRRLASRVLPGIVDRLIDIVRESCAQVAGGYSHPDVVECGCRTCEFAADIAKEIRGRGAR